MELSTKICKGIRIQFQLLLSFQSQSKRSKKKMQGNLSAWLVKHGIVHISLSFDY
ncbi:hypothetical protein MTR_5g082500 [Medicago truncatula]|uniref:Uncharacterized protein n=1 Tax=Medicago truncatula TaxID=3880 RepID=G7KH00_MEDTR|nr:hypothetical protein MTR_5g082500 [Medicago truncatula]